MTSEQAERLVAVAERSVVLAERTVVAVERLVDVVDRRLVPGRSTLSRRGATARSQKTGTVQPNDLERQAALKHARRLGYRVK